MNYTLIERGGGNRPYDAQQPVKIFTKVLIPTDSNQGLKDKGRKTCSFAALFLF